MKYHLVTKGNREYICDEEPVISNEKWVNFMLPIVEGVPNMYPEGTKITIPVTEVIAMLWVPEEGETPYGEKTCLKSV